MHGPLPHGTIYIFRDDGHHYPMQSTSPPPLRLAWFVWALGALFYLMAFFQRVAPAVMTAELMREFGISAAALGNLSAFYFYSYVAMQIPTGILADLWGPRRLLSLGAVSAGMGTLVFALGPTFVWVCVGRFLIGGSVAVAFVGLLQVANNWFPVRHYSLVAGVALFFGIVGAVAAGPPLRLLVNQYDWRSVILGSAVVTFCIAAAIWLLVRDYPYQKGYRDPRPVNNTGNPAERQGTLAGIVEIFHNRNALLLFFIPGGIVGCVLTFSGLWGVPFLADHHGLSTTQASVLTSAVLVALATGGPLFGWLSDRLGQRKSLYIAGCTIALTGWTAAFWLPGLSVAALSVILLVAGLGSGCMIISFAFAKESVPVHLSGTVAGVVNMGVMMGPMLLQPLVGWMLDSRWQGNTLDGVRHYGPEAYRAGFSLMLAWLALSLLLLFFTRETHCQQVD